MNILRCLTDCFSRRRKAMSLYKRGMVKARKHDHEGAILDYTMSIGVPGAPPEVAAMALYNRALIYAATGASQDSINDLQAVLAMNEALVNIKSMARQKLSRMASRPAKVHA